MASALLIITDMYRYFSPAFRTFATQGCQHHNAGLRIIDLGIFASGFLQFLQNLNDLLGGLV